LASRSKKVRVGIVRCDTHAFWYAHIFQRPDPVAMRKHHRGCHYYFYKPDNPMELRRPPVPGMEVTRIFDEDDPSLAESLAEALGGRAKVCRRLDEVSDGVDLVYIADCNFEGKDHLRYATPGLKKGVPHFVDKPLAHTLGEARKIIQLAERHNTAVMCASLLRYNPRLLRFARQLADIAPVRRVDVPGNGPSLAGVYHAVAAAKAVMGYGCEWVDSMGAQPFDVMRLHFPGPGEGTEVFLFNAKGPVRRRTWTAATYHHCEVFGMVSAYGEGGAAHAPRIGDYEYPEGGYLIGRMAKRLALTRRPPIDYAEILEHMEIIEAARLAHNRGRRVSLRSVRRS